MYSVAFGKILTRGNFSFTLQLSCHKLIIFTLCIEHFTLCVDLHTPYVFQYNISLTSLLLFYYLPGKKIANLK